MALFASLVIGPRKGHALSEVNGLMAFGAGAALGRFIRDQAGFLIHMVAGLAGVDFCLFIVGVVVKDHRREFWI
jgi:hypothetical protein